MKTITVITIFAICFFSMPLNAETVSLSVDAGKVIRQIDPRIYGQFLEHIYHSCNGGIWGELVWNRSFEEGQPGFSRRGAPPSTRPATVGTSPARHWTAVNDAVLKSDSQNPLNDQKCLQIVTGKPDGGISQTNFCLHKGDVCRGSIWIRGQAPDGIAVRIVDGTATLAGQTLRPPTDEWKEYALELNPAADAGSATLQIVSRGKASFWLDQVSLMPDSFRANGGFRTDLLQAVDALHPTTIRWPGGSFIGNYDWKHGIGPQSKRVGKKGWDEYDPLSFGLDEFMALCHKVGAEPVLVIYTGPKNKSDQRPHFVQEALDELEYCNGSPDSQWGKVRANNGHPEPYRVKYWEIDNEIWMSKPPVGSYLETVSTFSSALRARDPSIEILACGGRGTNNTGDSEWNLKMLAGDVKSFDYLSIHHYENPNNFAKGVENFDRHFATLRELIARTSNPNLKLYLSEWNAQSTDWRTGLYAGGLLNVMERNSDIIPMACPALFLRHLSAPSWDNAFINFDQRGWFPAPNYVVMKLFRQAYEPNLLAIEGDLHGLNLTASSSEDRRQLSLKAINPTDIPEDVQFEVKGQPGPVTATFQCVAPGDLSARNTLQQVDRVCAADAAIHVQGGVLMFGLPAYSVGVVRANLN